MKKFFVLPVCVLLLLTAASLLNAWHTGELVDAWCAGAERAEEAAERGDWASAARQLSAVRGEWDRHMTYFHIVLQHEELNDAEELLAQAERYLESRETADFCAGTAALRSQLRVLGEMQQVSIRNIL